MKTIYIDSKVLFDWLNINVLPNLIIGLILVIVGVFIWKFQFYYQKKLEVYSEIIIEIYRMKTSLMKEYKEGLTLSEKKEVMNKSNEFMPLSEKYLIYFGEKYRSSLYDLLNLISYSLNEDKKKLIDIDKEAIINLGEDDYNLYLKKRTEYIYNSIKRKK